MSVDENQDLGGPAAKKDGGYGSWDRLDLEVRLAIWGLAYATAAGRIVEVRTAEHDHDHDGEPHRWCPRYSPSPPPNVVNVCAEAREEARRLARRAGHLLFATAPDTPDIYYAPAIDTLYLPNQKNYRIRDLGPEGVLTQLKQEPRPERIRYLAIDLDPLSRGRTFHILDQDFKGLSGLEGVILVAGDEELAQVGRLDQGQGRDLLARYYRRREAEQGTIRSFRLYLNAKEFRVAGDRGVCSEYIKKR